MGGAGMAWEARDNSRRTYYTRWQRINGKVARTYIGSHTNPEAVNAYRQDVDARSTKRAEREGLKALCSALATIDAHVAVLAAQTALSLYAAGFYCHRRSDWRPRRHYAAD
jgi:hypothetical protein